MAQDVLCEVNSCKYWAAGNKCNASSIYVVNNRGKQARNTKETDCKTFEPVTSFGATFSKVASLLSTFNNIPISDNDYH